MAVLVTGGAGYIGGHMVLGLLDAGEEPVVIDNMSNGVPWAIPNGVRFVLGDSGDYETVARTIETHKVDAVIHFAARLITPQFYDDPLEYYHANTVKSRTLLSAVQNLGVRLVRGRHFNAADTDTTEPVAVVNEAFVRRFFKSDEDPLDRG